jgi:hypothetical protein
MFEVKWDIEMPKTASGQQMKFKQYGLTKRKKNAYDNAKSQVKNRMSGIVQSVEGTMMIQGCDEASALGST